MIADILFVVALVGIACLPFIRALWKSEVESCRFAMFSVRDNLVLMVAKGKLNKESIIFEHYYKMSNDVLRLTEKMHFEGLFQALIESKQSEAQIEAYQELIEQVHEALKNEDDEIRQIVSAYYKALIEITLINSNLFSIVYVISKKVMQDSMQKKAMIWASKHDPKPAKVFHDVEYEQVLIGLAA